MNVFQMYVHNGNKAGFKIRRKSWTGNRFAIVIRVDNKQVGELDGIEPYFNSPKVLAWDSYHKRASLLNCPGTYTYEFLEYGDPKIK